MQSKDRWDVEERFEHWERNMEEENLSTSLTTFLTPSQLKIHNAGIE